MLKREIKNIAAIQNVWYQNGIIANSCPHFGFRIDVAEHAQFLATEHRVVVMLSVYFN